MRNRFIINLNISGMVLIVALLVLEIRYAIYKFNNALISVGVLILHIILAILIYGVLLGILIVITIIRKHRKSSNTH